MAKDTASSIVLDFLMDKRKLDSEVYEAIRVQYLIASAVKDKESVA